MEAGDFSDGFLEALFLDAKEGKMASYLQSMCEGIQIGGKRGGLDWKVLLKDLPDLQHHKLTQNDFEEAFINSITKHVAWTAYDVERQYVKFKVGDDAHMWDVVDATKENIVNLFAGIAGIATRYSVINIGTLEEVGELGPYCFWQRLSKMKQSLCKIDNNPLAWSYVSELLKTPKAVSESLKTPKPRWLRRAIFSDLSRLASAQSIVWWNQKCTEPEGRIVGDAGFFQRCLNFSRWRSALSAQFPGGESHLVDLLLNSDADALLELEEFKKWNELPSGERPDGWQTLNHGAEFAEIFVVVDGVTGRTGFSEESIAKLQFPLSEEVKVSATGACAALHLVEAMNKLRAALDQFGGAGCSSEMA